MHRGLVFNIQRYSLADGPGIRTTVFLKGCPLDCWWCHNPESQSPEPQLLVAEQRCIRCGLCREACPQDLASECQVCGACVEACPTGARKLAGGLMTVEQILEQVRKDRVFYEESGGGISLSGGEPLMQFDFAVELLAACQAEGIHTALDTSGFAPLTRVMAAADCSNLVLYDLKMMDEQRHVHYTGVSNRVILENLAILGQSHGNIWMRMPIIPGINDSEAELAQAAKMAAGLPGVRKVCLLPYHQTGMGKFQRLSRAYRLEDVSTPTPQRMEQIAGQFRSAGLDVSIGG